MNIKYGYELNQEFEMKQHNWITETLEDIECYAEINQLVEIKNAIKAAKEIASKNLDKKINKCSCRIVSMHHYKHLKS